MSRTVLFGIWLVLVNAQADSAGIIKIGIFEGNNIAVELSGEAATEIAKLATSSKNIQCKENVCKFDFDNNAKSKKPKLILGDAPKKDQYYFSTYAGENNSLKISSYSASGDPNRGTMVKALYQILETESKREGTKVIGEAISNHDYAYEGIHMRCSSFVSGDFLCEMNITKAGLIRN